MSLSDIQKQKFKEVLKDQGFLGIDHKGKYILSDGSSTTSLNRVLKYINFPEGQLHIPELAPVCAAYAFKKLNNSDLVSTLREFSDENPIESTLPTLNLDYGVEDEEAMDLNEYIKGLVPAINVKDISAKNGLILLDPNNHYRPVLDIDPELYVVLSERPLQALMASEEVLKVIPVFDPYVLKPLYAKELKSGSGVFYHLNRYVPPQWRFVGAEPKYTGLVKKLIDHLIPDHEEREYVLDWMHYALTYRNDTVLCLIGARGTGKGVLIKDILGNLIGTEYREIVNQEILTDKFNSAFKNKRLIFFDEVNVSGDRELNKFKALCNDTIVLEAKGQDSETIDNYTSMALSSNDKKDFRAEPQERRFSVPRVTDRPLLDVISEDDLDAFCKRLSEPMSEELAEFGEFLLARKPKYTSRRPWKGEYFFDLCRLSMPEWKTFFIDYVVHEGVIGENIKLSNIAKHFKKVHGKEAKFIVRRGTVETFLGDYVHKGTHRLGYVVDAWDGQRGRDTFEIVPNEDFLRKFGARYKEDVEEDFDDALDAL